MVCVVRDFSIGKCTISLELDRAGLNNYIARDSVQGFSFYYDVIIMLFKLIQVQQEGFANKVWFKLVQTLEELVFGIFVLSIEHMNILN